MDLNAIKKTLKSLDFSSRKIQTTAWYLFSIMSPFKKKTTTFIESISGLHSSTISKLLGSEPKAFSDLLNRASRRLLCKLAKNTQPLIKGTKFKIAIIIDATLHERSSKKTDNAQYFNHGKGYVWGHQWTNIVLLVGGYKIPIPPIAFYSKKYCLENNVKYLSENQKVANFIKNFCLKGLFEPEEVIVLMDSGYDDKKIQQAIISRKWSFICALKSTRKISIVDGKWEVIKDYFQDGRRPWKRLRFLKKSHGKKWCCYQTKHKQGYLKDIRRQVLLICSRKRNGGVKYFSCSDPKSSPRAVLQLYKLRWKIEIFHREIKSYLGLQDYGAHSFLRLHCHLLLVFLAYLFLCEEFPKDSILAAQRKFEIYGELKRTKKQVQLLTQINSKQRIKSQYLSVIQDLELSMSA